jgi:hypothetical protein
MKPNRFSFSLLFSFISSLLLFMACSGLKTSSLEQDDAYYNSNDRKIELQALARAAELERKDEEIARAKAQAQAESDGKNRNVQPDYVNPEYKASGQAPLAPQNQTQSSQGNNYTTNNYYQGNSLSNWGLGFTPYTTLGYNWMYPGYSGISWRVSSFWGPMWATSYYNTWDYGFGYSPYYNPYSYNPFAWYNPWYYRPFYRYPGYYGGSYWDNYQGGSWGGGGSSGGTGGRIKTNLPLGGTGTGVYGGGPSGGRGEGGRLGGREAVSGTTGSDIHSGGSISTGTREQAEPRRGFWRRNGNLGESNSGTSGSSSSSTSSGYSGTRDQQSSGGNNSSSGSFWRGNQRTESTTKSWENKSTSPSPSYNSNFSGGRSQTSGSSSGWGSGSVGGRSKSVTPSSGSGPSGGRRR